MVQSTNTLGEIIGLILRGAATMVGCTSSFLVLIDEPSSLIRLHVGVTEHTTPLLAEVERTLGRRFEGISLPMATDSLAYRAWRERVICETASLPKLAGSALPTEVLEQIAAMIGPRRYVAIPALSADRTYGVLIFEKPGRRRYSRQQREVLWRQARAIGELVETRLLGLGSRILPLAAHSDLTFVLLDPEGRLLGHGPHGSAIVEGLLGHDPSMERLGAVARACGRQQPAGGGAPGREVLELSPPDLAGSLRASLSVITMEGRRCVMCRLSWQGPADDGSLDSRLLRLALGRQAATVFIDERHHITSCNPETERLFACSSGRLSGQPVATLFRDPRAIARLIAAVAGAPAAPLAEQSLAARRADGSLFAARVRALPLLDDRARRLGLLLLVRERRLGAEAGRATERLATMGEMAAQLAHEIRGPLVAVGAALRSLQREPELPLPHGRALGELAREVERVDLTLASFMAGRGQDLELGEVGLASVVADARRSLCAAGPGAAERIELDIDEQLRVRADYQALRQLIVNLLRNGLEATAPGGRVRCAAQQGQSEVTVVVRDDGPGLRASADECMRPFFTTKRHGTGLGLAVCERISRAHGGVLDLRNVDGGGCEAVLVLPDVPAPAGEPARWRSP